MKKNSFLLILLLLSNVLFAQKNLTLEKFGTKIFQQLKQKEYEKIKESFIDSNKLTMLVKQNCLKLKLDDKEIKKHLIYAEHYRKIAIIDFEIALNEEMENQTNALNIDFNKAKLKKVTSILNKKDSLLNFHIQFQEKNKTYFLILENVYYHHKFASPYLTNFDIYIIDSLENYKKLNNKSESIARKVMLRDNVEYDLIEPKYEIGIARKPTEEEFSKKDKSIKEIFVDVEQMPEFSGGEDALSRFINKNTNYPQQAFEKGIEGKVEVGFIVNEDGGISEIRVLKGIGYGCDEEAIRVTKLMPKWKPGKQNGKPVNVRFSIPFYFASEIDE